MHDDGGRHGQFDFMKQFDFSTKARRKEAWLSLATVWAGLDYIDQQVRRMDVERGLKDNFLTAPSAAKRAMQWFAITPDRRSS